jgi:hypothetical protein
MGSVLRLVRSKLQLRRSIFVSLDGLFDPPFPPLILEKTPEMSKVTFLTLVAALVCVAGSAKADNGIPSNTLGQLGLPGLTVISDRDALAIRGFGLDGSNFHLKTDCCGARGSASPSAKAMGSSGAMIDIGGTVADNCPGCNITGGSHSENSYNAMGPYSASGSNYSEAGVTISKAEIVDGVGALLTTCTTKVWAGGNSSAKAF